MRLSLFLAAAPVLQVQAMECSPAAFASILRPFCGATVNSAVSVPANGSYGGGLADIAFPTNATGLPSLCAVSINVPSSSTTSYNFGLFLPESWNGRFLATGNGGYGGGINWPDMGVFSQYGFTTMSTDTGHVSNALDGTWGYQEPEKLYDWGYRAMHGSVSMAKQVAAAYYSANVSYSYYASCSTGGRQGLKEIQLHPDSFDGVVVGAPAWDMVHLPSSTLKAGLYNLPVNSSHYIPPSLFSAIVNEVTRQCDPQDGVKDGIVSDPFGCNFQFEALLCKPGSTSACLTGDQLSTVYKFYNDFVDVNQTFVFPGLALGADPTFLLAAPVELGIDFFKYWVLNDTNWNYLDYTYADIQLAEKIRPGDAPADNFDLSPFRARGGKLLQYHGLADNLIQTGTSLVFYRKVYQALLEKGIVSLDDFYRLFFVPGMAHCSGSANAPWYIAGGSQVGGVAGATHSVPGFMDPEHDIILAMMKWVEEGTAPDQIIATKFWNDTVADGVQIQRPLCVYPKQAKYSGSGDTSDPSNWSCESLY